MKNRNFGEDGEHWVDTVTPHLSRQLCPYHKAKAEKVIRDIQAKTLRTQDRQRGLRV